MQRLHAAALVVLAGACTVDSNLTPTADTAVETVEYCTERPNCTQRFCDQVLIAADTFEMGSSHAPHEDSYWPSGDERPRHWVQLDSFCIDKYEVTLQRYERCVDAGVCTPDGLNWRGIQTVVNHYPPHCNNNREACRQHAVNAKSYHQAKTYCEWAGGRLCTEAEWERAANGPGDQRRRHPWGRREPNSTLVNIPSTGTGYVEEVDDYEAGQSAEGVFNLAGNVYEWVEDAYDLYPDSTLEDPVVNPSNPPASREVDGVGRGSCFFTEPEHTVAERSVFPLDFDWG